jgi:ubiquinone/menaquinone biosynthesis C-methylase UbiE
MPRKFDPSQLERLENPGRLAAMHPERLLRKIGLRRDMRFADVGAGAGFFALPAAGLVGPGGRVFALDTQRVMLDHLRAKSPPPWVEPLECGECSLPLPDVGADISFACFVLHEVGDPISFLREMGRITKPRSPVVIMEWARRRQAEGPPLEERLHHHRVESLVLEAGLCFRGVEFLNASWYLVRAFRK